MFYQGKRCLVTGGTGFIGTNIVQELLRQGAKVRISIHKRPLTISDSNIETIYTDLTRQEDCLAAVKGIEYVFDAAGAVGSAGAESSRIMSVIATDLILGSQILRAAWLEGVDRFLLFSSSTTYPEADYPIKEEEMWSKPPHPIYFGYGWMKRCMERMGEFVASNSNVKIALVRPTAPYGCWDNFNLETCHVIPALIKKAVEKQSPYIVWGSGEEVRDFLDARDLARGCLMMLEKYAICDPVNIGYGKGVTIREVAQIILKAVGYENANVQFDASKPTAIPFRVVDTSKAKKMLGFEPEITLNEGLANTIRWYKNNVLDR